MSQPRIPSPLIASGQRPIREVAENKARLTPGYSIHETISNTLKSLKTLVGTPFLIDTKRTFFVRPERSEGPLRGSRSSQLCLDFEPPTSSLPPPTFDFQLPTFNFRPVTSKSLLKNSARPVIPRSEATRNPSFLYVLQKEGCLAAFGLTAEEIFQQAVKLQLLTFYLCLALLPSPNVALLPRSFGATPNSTPPA